MIAKTERTGRMRRRHPWRALAAGLALAASIPALGAGAAAGGAKEEAKADPLAGLEKTGRVERCLGVTRIDTTKILDRRHILFRMRGGRLYLNTLPHECPGLRWDRAISYSLSGPAQLCDLDIIRVIDTGLHQEVGSCGLGRFEEVVRSPAADGDPAAHRSDGHDDHRDDHERKEGGESR